MSTPRYTSIGTTPPEPNLTIRIYDAVNNGSFAVILVAIGGLIYLKRSLKELLSSPFADSLLKLIQQIENNQEHIESMALDVDRMDKSTADILALVSSLQAEIAQSGELNKTQYSLIMKELQSVKSILDRRGTKNEHNHQP